MAGKSEGRSNHKAQSATTVSRNKRLKAERHTRRMTEQELDVIRVPRGTARNERRKPLQAAYAAKLAQ